MQNVESIVMATAMAFAVSLVLTPLARHLAWRVGAISEPDGKRKLHARPTALFGGGAVCAALLLSIVGACLLASDAVESKLPAALGFSAGMLCLLGFYDDLYDMPAVHKLLGQIVSTLPIVVAGACVQEFVIFGHAFDVGLMGIPCTIGWLVLGINALNLLDGVDGLASLLGIVIAVTIGLIAAAGHPGVMLLAFILAGALAGFLVYNLPPARIYLGDCGSMVIGFTLALLAMRVSLLPKAPATSKLTVAVALLFVPLLDVALAVIRRTLKGMSFMAADHGHIHHQLLRRGLNNWMVLGVLGSFGLTTGAIAWWVNGTGRELLGWAVLGLVTLLLASRKFIAYEEWCLGKQLFARLGRRLRLPELAKPSEPRPEEFPEPVILKAPFPDPTDQEPPQKKAA